jgi:hypothetical protein
MLRREISEGSPDQSGKVGRYKLSHRHAAILRELIGEPFNDLNVLDYRTSAIVYGFGYRSIPQQSLKALG